MKKKKKSRKNIFLFLLSFLSVSFFFQIMMKTKWRCRICEKLLASKQTALKHLVLVHKSDDHIDSVIKVQVQETNNENKVTKENPKGPPTVKNKAYGFFAPLTNIFNDENMVEGFSWGDKSKKSDQNDNSVASSSLDVGLDLSEAIVDAAESDLTTFENVFSNKKSNTARPTFVPPILPEFHLPRNVLDQTISDFPDISPGPAFIQSLEIDPTLDSTVDGKSYNHPPDKLPEESPHSKSDSTTPSFTTIPLKTRGHCGREDCA